LVYLRHPFVWLVEAADDICYNIIDLEDAQRLGIIDHDICIGLLTDLIKDIGIDNIQNVEINLSKMTDKNDRVSYLRAKSINSLTQRSIEIYQENFDDIINGRFATPLYNVIKSNNEALKKIIAFSKRYIYNHRSVIEIENAGFNVMYELLSHFILPILNDESSRSKSEKKAILLIPTQFLYEEANAYQRVLGILDYVSGMTDNYAIDLYRRIKGIEIGMKI